MASDCADGYWATGHDAGLPGYRLTALSVQRSGGTDALRYWRREQRLIRLQEQRALIPAASYDRSSDGDSESQVSACSAIRLLSDSCFPSLYLHVLARGALNKSKRYRIKQLGVAAVAVQRRTGPAQLFHNPNKNTTPHRGPNVRTTNRVMKIALVKNTCVMLADRHHTERSWSRSA